MGAISGRSIGGAAATAAAKLALSKEAISSGLSDPRMSARMCTFDQ
jgi:hypothetical protein